MKRLVFFLILLALVGGLVFWLVQNNDGNVLISTRDYVVQFSLWTALITVVVVLVGLRLIYAALRAILAPGVKMFTGRSQRRQLRWQQKYNNGMLALAEGRWDIARRDLLQSADKLDVSSGVIGQIAAANAAAESGDVEAALATLNKLEEEAGGEELAIGVTRARILMARERYAEALTRLLRLHEHYSHHPLILGSLGKIYRETGAWDKLDKLLPDLERCKVIDKSEAQNLSALVRRSQIDALHGREQADEEKLNQLEQLWDRTAKPIRARQEVLGAYVQALAEFGDEASAVNILRKAINKNWDDNLVLLYADLKAIDPVKQLTIAEGWLRTQAENPKLLLALGRLCKRNKLWGKGRDYLEASLNLDNNPQTCAELAEVMAQLGDAEKCGQLFRKGLLSSLGVTESMV
ncbi:MAG TPA: hypothetical protein DIT58_03755 [Porticoccaceae bacterium]|nr:hypothetical protein [Porticoccaceae bacterium]